MHLQTTSPESKFPNEYTDVIFIQIDQHLKKLLPKYKGVPILWNTVYTRKASIPAHIHTIITQETCLPANEKIFGSKNCYKYGERLGL